MLWYSDHGEESPAVPQSLGSTLLTALVRRAGLEDVFPRLTGRKLVD